MLFRSRTGHISYRWVSSGKSPPLPVERGGGDSCHLKRYRSFVPVPCGFCFNWVLGGEVEGFDFVVVVDPRDRMEGQSQTKEQPKAEKPLLPVSTL